MDDRRGKNTQLPLPDLLRESIYSRLAGYEDVNDAERLSRDPTFVCPSTHKAGCTIRVEVSAVIWAVTPSNVAQRFLNISGRGAALDPNSVVNVSTNTGSFGEAATFQFMKRQIPAGSTQTVHIYFQMGFTGGSANSGFRTATVQLYLN